MGRNSIKSTRESYNREAYLRSEWDSKIRYLNRLKRRPHKEKYFLVTLARVEDLANQIIEENINTENLKDFELYVRGITSE